MSTVSIVKCNNYHYDTVKEAVKNALSLIGGISTFIKPGEKVLLKVNLLIRRIPEKATTTHPALAQALAELVMEAGGLPIIGDSPGGYHFYNQKTLEAVYETCGMKEAAEKSGAELNYNTEMIDIPYHSILHKLRTNGHPLYLTVCKNVPCLEVLLPYHQTR